MKIKLIPLTMTIGLLLNACNVDRANNSRSIPNSNPDLAIATPSDKANGKVERVVALTSLSADILAHLDRTKLVGITGSQILTSKKTFQDLPRVAQGRTPPNLERIIALKPDLVIGAKGMHETVLNKLKSTGIQTLTTEVNSWQALQQLTQEIATLTGSNPQPLLDRYRKMVTTPAKSAGKTELLRLM